MSRCNHSRDCRGRWPIAGWRGAPAALGLVGLIAIVWGAGCRSTGTNAQGSEEPATPEAEVSARDGAPLDLVLTGGRVLLSTASAVDPLEAMPELRRLDVGIRGDRIVLLGDLRHEETERRLDVAGRIVAPGFIDAHSHTARALSSQDRSGAEALLAQGITTVIVNPDGWGPTDLALQRCNLLEHGLGVHVAQLIGHGAVRREVLGDADRPPSRRELDRMRDLVETAVDLGAVGLSSGTFYAPGSFADTDELVALARIAGLHQSHIRDESDYSVGLVAAVDEVIEIARRSATTGVVTHIKALGPPVWGASERIVERIESARRAGVDMWADQYPYPASATGLGAALLPRWAQEGGPAALQSRLADPPTRRRIVEAMRGNLERRGGAERIQFRHVAFEGELEGRRLGEVAAERQRDPVDFAADLIRRGEVGIVSFNMHGEDVDRFARQRWVMTASDGAYPPWGRGVPHPRSFGAFPRRLADFVRERGVVPLEQALDGMTRLPATVYHLSGRGRVEIGAVADLTVFDPQTIRDRATFERPYRLAEGVDLVLVSGRIAWRDGAATGVRAGQVLRRGRRGAGGGASCVRRRDPGG